MHSPVFVAIFVALVDGIVPALACTCGRFFAVRTHAKSTLEAKPPVRPPKNYAVAVNHFDLKVNLNNTHAIDPDNPSFSVSLATVYCLFFVGCKSNVVFGGFGTV
jgi:hypothetical protein